MPFEIKRAKRKASPILMSIAGTSGSGKTYSALLVAAGIAGEAGVVGLIDAENGRGSMYADSPGIMAALPQGFLIVDINPPFVPERYIEALKAMEDAGVTVCVVDSTSHEWEGEGGCTDIAENNKLGNMPNWAKAKLGHKRFVNHCLSSQMSIIFCLRAREKAKPVKGSKEYLDLGIQPVCEKNFVFEMLISLMLDEATHNARPLKIPEPLENIVGIERMLTKADGERIRQWNDTGTIMGEFEQLEKRAGAIVERGMIEYEKHFKSLKPGERKHLIDSGQHATNKVSAEKADAKEKATKDAEESMSAKLYDALPDAMEYGLGAIIALNDGTRWTPNAERSAWVSA